MRSCPLCPVLSVAALVAVPAVLLIAAAPAQVAKPADKKEWAVHDPARPQPPMVDTAANKAPSDAIVLFDGTNLDKWTGNGGTADWFVKDGYFEVKPGSGNIRTRRRCAAMQLPT